MKDIERAVCVEMNPDTFRRLRFNMENNFPNYAVCLNAAVYSANGEMEVAVGGKGGSGYSIHYPATAERHLEKIATVTFDTLTETYFPDGDPIDICKMDIEGAEYDVLLSDTASHLARCRHVIIEIHPHIAQRPAQELFDLFAQRGFVCDAPEGIEPDVYFYTNTALPAA